MALFRSGGFKGTGDKTSTTTNTTTSDNSNVAASDNSLSARLDNSTLNVNTLDGGAIKEAFDFGNRSSADAFDFSRGVASDAFDFSSRVNNAAISTLTEGTASILNKVTTDSGERIQTLTQTMAKYSLYAVLAIVALMIFKRG